MNIYTYYQQVAGMQDFSPLINLWKEKWTEVGFNPIVLTNADCKPKPLFDLIVRHVSTLPTINPQNYTINNFTRWIAMDYVKGGLHIDSDVFPGKNIDKLSEYKWDHNRITILQKDNCPCGVWIPADGCRHLIAFMLDYNHPIKVNGQDHCCDQEFYRWVKPHVAWLDTKDVIGSYLTEENYLDYPMIHYPTANLPAGDKATIIRSLL
jgi:hypothetical protein